MRRLIGRMRRRASRGATGGAHGHSAPRSSRADSAATDEGRRYQLNRTLSAHVRAATEKSASLRSQTLRAYRRRQRMVHTLVIAAAAIVIVVLLSLQLDLSFTLQTPDSISARHLDRYRAVLDDYFARRPGERLRPLLQAEQLQQHFLRHAPEVKTVRLESARPFRAVAKLTFRQPVAQWATAEKTSFVDGDGVTFEKNYHAAPRLSVHDESGVPIEGGREVVSRSFLGFLGRAVAAFDAQGIVVIKITLPPGAVRQVTLSLEGREFPVKMTTDRSATAQVAQAMHALRYVEQRGLKPEYLDVRVDQRVFYR